MVSFSGDARRAAAVPLGGIGTGTVALRADGSLDQWQLANVINHVAPAPSTFLGLRVATLGSGRPADHASRVLRAHPPAAPATPPQDSTDWRVPDRPAIDWPLLADSRAEVDYPFVRVEFDDDTLPVRVATEAWTPFVPGDLDASSLPLIEHRVDIENTGPAPLFGFAVYHGQNTVGWDGASPVDGVWHGRYGGNVNRLVRNGNTTAVVMDNPGLRDDDPFAGEQVVATDAPCWPLVRCDGPAATAAAVAGLALIDCAGSGDWSDARLRANTARLAPPVHTPHGPSPAGRTWDTALCAAWHLAPGERTTVRFVHAWRFPNRYLDFLQQYVDAGPGGRRLWVGNHYATRFGTAMDVVRHFRENETDLRAASRSWADGVAGTELAEAELTEPVRHQLTLQSSSVRNPVLFRTADGRCYGHEGGNGASNEYWSGHVGGSCPLNCNHVWNYAQTMSRLFGEFERSMRDTEWAAQDETGSIPHRIVLPAWLPQYRGGPIGGPKTPALDGMLGAVLKTYREARQGGGAELLSARWPEMLRVIDHVEHGWHTRGDGILRGPQPTTYDYPLTGPNMIIGSLWLATLATMYEVADVLGEPGRRFAELRATAARNYHELLWNGEYYVQTEPAGTDDYGLGCHADQLIGQWWAHQLELGHLLDPEHVRGTLRAILLYNDRERVPVPDLGARAFADGADGGLVNCSWPHGGRPDKPVHYCDESWVGTEYQVAAHCLMEGMGKEAAGVLRAVHRRKDGTRRNPFNEIECGDHYVRGQAGWSVLEAATGFRYDAVRGRLTVDRDSGTFPFVAGGAWGRISAAGGRVRIAVVRGTLDVASVRIAGTEHALSAPVPAGESVDVGAG
ncbi:hypothetical protein CFN78_04215 [Amycolatopsis antarctica]|uniref:Glycosyl-hydrolase family 116 catalytic region domain-containing protein n=1 Tax=Amycolatopsis antarctica TaxID=1854586 RepID=A0A263DAD9_9PSEU|nr:GH116 family glycosyl-hydrolase [Amycolatopsis antarctica]OZM74345.1 hypothetical protein CFN78_04215 [Amycolatopsis antarctica]